uniref:SUEL-type lectin domain-containing protein n=1 Tax=Clastoptera arizonana TaxID=38151 RepID=A0A1B6DP31_9HEMI
MPLGGLSIMFRLCIAAFLFSLFSLTSGGVPRTSEQPRYDTAYACEGKTLKIECKDGELIHLIRANYGRFSITICNDHGNTEWSVNCMSPKSLRVLFGRCSKKSTCQVDANSTVFGDPCPGTSKYLEVHYTCKLVPGQLHGICFINVQKCIRNRNTQ